MASGHISSLIRRERGSQRSFTDEMGLELFAFGAFGQTFFEIMDIGTAAYEGCILQQLAMQRDIGVYAFDRHF